MSTDIRIAGPPATAIDSRSWSKAWQVGQLLNVVALRSSAPGERTDLRIGTLTVPVQTRLPLTEGDRLQVQVHELSPRPVLRVIASAERVLPMDEALRPLLRQALPRQLSLNASLARLVEVADEASDFLEPALRRMLRTVVAQVPDHHRVFDPGGLRRAVQGSGLWMEARQLQSGPHPSQSPEPDLKTALLRVLTLLTARPVTPDTPTAPRTPAPPPAPPGPLPQAQARAAPGVPAPRIVLPQPLVTSVAAMGKSPAESLPLGASRDPSTVAPVPGPRLPAPAPPAVDTPASTREPARPVAEPNAPPAHRRAAVQPGSPQLPSPDRTAAVAVANAVSETTLASLRPVVEGAVARITLHQAASVEASAVGGEAHWLLEVPLRHPGGMDVLPLRISRERHRRGTGQDSHRWSVGLALDLPGLGPLHARVTLADSEVSARFWAESEATTVLLSDHLEQLNTALVARGVVVAGLTCQTGSPPVPEGNPSGRAPVLDERA